MLKRPGRRHAVLALIACLCTPFAAAAAAAGDSLVAGLPASFAGVLPYPGCAEARTQLDLWPDGVFHRQRICLDQPGRDDDRGRWRRAANEQRILLHRGREMPLGFAWRDAAHLLPLDLHRQPPADAATGLRRLPAFAPAPLQLALHGMFSYLADAPGFSECLTGRAYPVAMEGDYLTLERTYMASPGKAPGAPLMASFDGEITVRPGAEGGRDTPTVVVGRFVGVWPGSRCERALSPASLIDQYWRIVSLRGQPVASVPGQREAQLVLHGGTGQYKGVSRCASLAGSYQVGGGRIVFAPPATVATRACAAPAGTSDARLRDVLGNARRWAINAQVLELFDEHERSIALIEAIHLR